MCLPDRLDRLERNCSSCLILDQLMASASSPMLHWQCGILCWKVLEVQKQWWDLESFWRRFFFLLSPPLFLTGFIGYLLDPKTIFRDAVNLDITLCHALIHGFYENIIDASSSFFKGWNWWKSFVLYCIIISCNLDLDHLSCPSARCLLNKQYE